MPTLYTLLPLRDLILVDHFLETLLLRIIPIYTLVIQDQMLGYTIQATCILPRIVLVGPSCPMDKVFDGNDLGVTQLRVIL